MEPKSIRNETLIIVTLCREMLLKMDLAAMAREQAVTSVRVEHADVLQPADLRLLGGLDIQWIDDSQGVGGAVVALAVARVQEHYSSDNTSGLAVRLPGV